MKKKIGYYNQNSYPVQLPPIGGASAPIHVRPGHPIVNIEGKLVLPPIPALDEEVRLGTIAYINEGDTNFSKWDEQVQRRSEAPVPLQKGADGFVAGRVPTQTTNTPPPVAPKEKIADVSHMGGVQLKEETTPDPILTDLHRAEALDNAKRLIQLEGKAVYEGVEFTSVKALDRFIKGKAEAVV